MEPNSRVARYIERCLAPTHPLHVQSSAEALLNCLGPNPACGLILFAWTSEQHSLAPLQSLRAVAPGIPILILTGTATTQDFHTFNQLGAAGVLLKPFLAEDLLSNVNQHLAPASTAQDATPQPSTEVPLDATHSFVRSSPAMLRIEAQASLVARSDIPVLILGESGTGKEVLAMYTHRMSARSHRIFLKVNCAAMPADLLESELFGYEQGAFTGAVRSKPGKFEIADGGTIFLDEIGEMPAILQAKLLHVLQDGSYSRLGSRAPSRTNVRVIAATNVNLQQAMSHRTFREDLYYRLNGLSLSLPPLRERSDEIPTLAAYFLRKGAERYGLDPLPLSSTLVEALCRYHWPGNLRELQNIMNRYLVLRDETAILDALPTAVSTPPVAPPPVAATAAATPAAAPNLKDLVRDLKGGAEAAAIASKLAETRWNRKAAAAELHISYKALLYKIKQYELSPR